MAVLIDLASCMVVGWQIADHLRTSMVADALVDWPYPRAYRAPRDILFRPRQLSWI